MAALDESHVEKKFRNVVTSQESIQSLSMWVVHHKAQHEKIVNIWFNVLKKSKLDHRLTLFYLANDIVQTCRRKHAVMYKDAFKEVMKDATLLVRDNAIKPPIERIFTIWKERGIYDAEFADELVAIINNTKVRATMNSKLLSEFQPLTLMEKVITLKRFEDEIELKRRQLRNLRLDASSIEAVKQLKDRTHGGEFCAEFEGACTKMEDYVKSLEKEISDRVALIEMLEQSELYYDAQYGEAKIVANAYKNFGTRVNSLMKKLDEKRATLPDSVTPVGSPLQDAPSPSPNSSPEQHLEKRLDSKGHKDHPEHDEKSHHHHHHHHHSEHHPRDHHYEDRHHHHQPKESEAYDYSLEYRPDSPVPPGVTSPIPPGVTTPEHVPPSPQYDMNTETIDMEMSDEEEASHHSKPPEKYEVKINEDVDMSPKSDDDFVAPQGSPILDNDDKKSAYIPSVVKGATTSFLDEILKTTATTKKDHEDGGSTPVMDEFENSSNSAGGTSDSAEKHDKNKQSKQNPIDFLTQLIGQTKKTNTNSSAGFFENLSLLTKTVKAQYNTEEKEENNSQQTTADSWAAWKAQNAPPPPLESPAPPIAPPLPQQNITPNSALISPDMPPVTKIHPTLLPPPTPPFQSPMPPPPFPPPPGSEVPYPPAPLQRQESSSYPGPNTPGSNVFPPHESSGYASFDSGQQSNSYVPTAPVNSNYPVAPSQGPNFENESSSYRPPAPGQQGFPPLPPAPPGLRFPPPPRLPESNYPLQDASFNQPPLPPPVSSSSSTFSVPAISQSLSYPPPPQGGQSTTPPSPYPPSLTPRAPLPPRPPYTPDNYTNPRFPHADHGRPSFPPPSPSSFGAPRTPNQPPSSRPFLRPPPTPPVVGGPGISFPLHRPPTSSQSQSKWTDGGTSPTHSGGQFRSGNQRSNLTTIKTVDDSEFDKEKSHDQPWSACLRSPHGHTPFPLRAPSQPPSPIASVHGNKNNFSSGGEGQQEFIEKLKRKSNPGETNGPPNHSMGDHFHSPIHANFGSNLRTLTQVTMDMSSGENVSSVTSVSAVSTTGAELNTTSASIASKPKDDAMRLSNSEQGDAVPPLFVAKTGGKDSQSSKDSSFDEKTSESESDTIGQHVGGFLQRLRAETEKGPKLKYRDDNEYSDFSEDTEEGMSPFKNLPLFPEGDGRGRGFHPRHQFRMRNPRGGGIPPRSYLPPDGGHSLHRMPFGDRAPGPFRRGMGRPPRGPYGPTGMNPHRGMGNHPGDFRPKRPPPLLSMHGGGRNRPFFPHNRY